MTTNAGGAIDHSKHRASFNTLIRPYLVIRIGLFLLSTIIFAPFAILWFLGVGQWWAKHYFDKLECELSDKSMRFRKGIFISVEKTIPLENIQDITFIEGPILRRFNLSTIKFETAGGTKDDLGHMHLTGIVDAEVFRNRILEARDKLKQLALLPHEGTDAQLAVLRQISAKLDQILAHQSKD
jgi:membrane protein YdbS with pleckstrin-like domain